MLAASASASFLLTSVQNIPFRHMLAHIHVFVNGGTETTNVYGTRAGQYGRELGNFGFGLGTAFAHPYPTPCP